MVCYQATILLYIMLYICVLIVVAAMHTHTHTSWNTNAFLKCLYFHFWFLRNIISLDVGYFCSLLLLLLLCLSRACLSLGFVCFILYFWGGLLWRPSMVWRFSYFQFVEIAWFCLSFFSGKYDFAFVCLKSPTHKVSEWNEYEWTTTTTTTTSPTIRYIHIAEIENHRNNDRIYILQFNFQCEEEWCLNTWCSFPFQPKKIEKIGWNDNFEQNKTTNTNEIPSFH